MTPSAARSLSAAAGAVALLLGVATHAIASAATPEPSTIDSGKPASTPPRHVALTLERPALFGFLDPRVLAAMEVRIAPHWSAVARGGYGRAERVDDGLTRVYDIGAQLRYYTRGEFDRAPCYDWGLSNFVGVDIGYQRLLDGGYGRTHAVLAPGLSAIPIVGMKLTAPFGLTVSLAGGVGYRLIAQPGTRTADADPFGQRLASMLSLGLGWSL